MPIPRNIWDKMCKQAQDEILEVLALFDAQAQSEVASAAFEVDLSDFILDLLQDDEAHYIEWYCD